MPPVGGVEQIAADGEILRGACDAQERGEGRDEVGMVAEMLVDGRGDAGEVQDEDGICLFAHESRVVAESSMLVELFAVVAGDDDDGVVQASALLEKVEDVREVGVKVMGGIGVAVVEEVAVGGGDIRVVEVLHERLERRVVGGERVGGVGFLEEDEAEERPGGVAVLQGLEQGVDGADVAFPGFALALLYE